MLVGSTLAFVLALAPSPASDAELALPQCREQGLDYAVGLGSASAPRTLRLYFDPTQIGLLQMWLEARRIVGEREAEMRLEVIPVRNGLPDADPDVDPVRVWFMAASSLGATEAALRLFERRDWIKLADDLRSPSGRATLAEAVGLEPELIDARTRGSSGRCLLRRLDKASRELAEQTFGQAAYVVGVIEADGSEFIQYTDSNLTELRSQIDRVPVEFGSIDETFGFTPAGLLPIGRTGDLDRTFANTGVLVGGQALPHQLVVFIEDEDSNKLSGWLEPAMRFRRDNPGRLAVQVIAVGVGTRAIQFRRRLCAARTLGLEVEYLDYLALRAAARHVYEAEITEVLQPIADSDACSDSEPLDFGTGSDGNPMGDFGQPREAWLDGRQVNANELENLQWQLDSEAKPSLLDWLMLPEQAPAEFGF
ncbi:hypothetical protein ACNOYE_27085 [Nannocystaceae bacterium ST9]